MNSKNIGRIEYSIQPGDYFLNKHRDWLRHVQDTTNYGRIVVTSYALKMYDIQPGLEFKIDTLLSNTRLSKKQAIKMLRIVGYEV
jgi:hypothetical protein